MADAIACERVDVDIDVGGGTQVPLQGELQESRRRRDDLNVTFTLEFAGRCVFVLRERTKKRLFRV